MYRISFLAFIVIYQCAFAHHAQAQSVVTTPGLTAGQCLRSTGASIIDDAPCSGRVNLVSSGASLSLTNDDCGSVIRNNGVTQSTITMPALPLANCEFTFSLSTFGFYIDFNGQHAELPGILGDVTQWAIPVVSAFRTNNPSVSLQYVVDRSMSSNSHWEQEVVSSPLYQTTLRPSSAAQVAHGQVYFKWNSSASRFELCPQNGPGGLIVDGAMHQVPIDCLTLAQSATTSSMVNYFYATYTQDDNLTVSAVSANTSGKVRLTFTENILGNVNDQVWIGCHSVDGDLHANVNDAGVIVSITQIDFLHTDASSTGTHASGGQCSIVRLSASTSDHMTFADGVEVLNASGTADTHYTLVGIAYIGASNAVNDSATKRDVASWFNRRAKTCINHYTADRTWASTSTWGEPNTEIRCEFVVFDDAHENAKTWSIAGMFGNSTLLDGTLVSAGFDPATMPAPETEVVGEKGNNISLGARGAKSSLTEGLHTISLLAKTLGGGTSRI